MSKRVKVMIAGAGGINSWFIAILAHLIEKDQIPVFWEFTIYDGDDVEKKNLSYQNFLFTDLLENKAEILAKRYTLMYQSKYVKSKAEFDKFDVVICGVDNKDFRKMLYEYMDEHPDKKWIDMRAEGRVVMVLTKNPKNTLAELMKTLPENDSNSSASCQLDYELSAGIVQLGNRIAATIGAQYLLNIVRGEPTPALFNQRF